MLVADLSAAYGAPASTAALDRPPQWSAYCESQASWPAGPEGRASRDFWCSRFSGSSPLRHCAELATGPGAGERADSHRQSVTMSTELPGITARTRHVALMSSDPGFSVWARTSSDEWVVSVLASARNFSRATAGGLLVAFARAVELLVTEERAALADVLSELARIRRDSLRVDRDPGSQVEDVV